MAEWEDEWDVVKNGAGRWAAEEVQMVQRPVLNDFSLVVNERKAGNEKR